MDLDLAVDLSDRSERAATLYRALRTALGQGRVQAGERLPPSRALAQDLGISRTTVAAVYERLTAEGFTETRVGAGTYVTTAAAAPRARDHGVLRPRATWQSWPQPVSAEAAVPAYDFRVGVPDASLFPFAVWRRLLAAEARLTQHEPGRYHPPAGLLRLRKAISHHLARSRGVEARADDIVVTNGAQQALDLLARVLLEPGDVVAVEDPGYPIARAVFAAYGARIVPVPVDADGIVVEAIPTDARIVCTTPSHQFPLGVPLSLARRRALLAFADTHDVAVVEDDYDSEFRFASRPLETLHGLDTSGRVVYVGTFSKSLLPSLRLGYLIAPPSLREALLAARQLTDSFGAVHAQATLARFIEDGLLAKHVRQASLAYAERRALLLDGLRDVVEVVPSAAGLHLAAYVEDARLLAKRAHREGLAVETLDDHALVPGRSGLVFGYGAAVTSTIPPGLALLRRLLHAV